MSNPELHIFEFWNEKTDEHIEVEAETFDIASNTLFSDDSYTPKDWELLTIDGKF